MIKTITMHDVASYKAAVEIKDLKRINLFYGLNGTGKTIISKYLSCCREENSRFKACKVEPENNTDQDGIFVYNEDFIEKNFLERADLKGIFTLDKTNVDAEKVIEEAESIKLEHKNSKAELELEKKTEEENQRKQKEKLEEEIWKSKLGYGEKPALKACMKGFLNSKVDFADRVKDSQLYPLEINQTVETELEKLETEMAELDDDQAQEKNPIPSLDYEGLALIEPDSLWSESITGSQNSYLTELVKKLHHSDWIKRGITEYLDKTDGCPFCAREMDSALKDKIKTFIDTTYQTKLDQLKTLKERYEGLKKRLEEQLDTEPFSLEELQGVKNQLKTLLQRNARSISDKIEKPSQPLELKSTQSIIDEINQAINSKNRDIEAFNSRLKNKKESIEKNKDKFWQLLRKEHDIDISVYESGRKAIQEKIDSIKKDIAEEDKLIEEQEKIIRENQAKTKNIDAAIKSINKRLKGFGAQGFQIEERAKESEPVPSYEIVRENADVPANTFEEAVYKTLSEGEKTLIAFLYFLETCKDSEKTPQAAKRIIVIDDPISSLSFNWVFDIAALIKHDIFNNTQSYQQVFVLTHHLYFFRELLKSIKGKGKEREKKRSLYRITKSEKTSIDGMKEDDLKSEYDAYWQVVKDVEKGKALPHILPNVMRHIVEYFFGFMGKLPELKDIKKELSEHGDPVRGAFFRCIARESHSDLENHLIDDSEIDAAKWISCLEKLFENEGYSEHYKKMMETEAKSGSTSEA